MATAQPKAQGKQQAVITSWFKKGESSSETRQKQPARTLDKENDEPRRPQSPAKKKQKPATKTPIPTKKKQNAAEKKKGSSDTCSKQMMAKRRKWVKDCKCFVCEEDFDKSELGPCQCFKMTGVKGFGLILCDSCDDDGILGCTKCSDRLCVRSCKYSTCYNCEETICHKCIESDIAKCDNCGRLACCSNEDDEKLFRECKSCHKTGCRACYKKIETCECSIELVCDDCVDKLGDPIDGRFCTECGDGGAEDLAREHEAICKYGANYEDYPW
jgi:hypothetical protein